MSSRLLNSALKLTPSQRILLAEQIWDSLAGEKEIPALSDPQKLELDRRLGTLRNAGPVGSSWSEVKARIKKRRNP